ncbi:nitroreductase [Cohnella faecalis]|uniref:Putative NAD(P)H nitroreductase n=1 Tax=Cohnella faecalis TaxID=2315694 RepID=A0A398D078_9BACL|nr:nitroreductase [Cohnella faecalis]RIE04574.1 nitroreductase [Cohnella faecalis]
MHQDQLEYPVAQLIRDRRTVRQFREDPVPQLLITKLLDIACWAPNHGFREPWRFIQYRGEARRTFAESVVATFSAEEKEKNGDRRLAYYMDIPVHLIVVAKEDPRAKQREEDFAAVCCWIQNFQLAAWERGLGVVWKTNPYLHAPAFRETVGVHAGERIAAVLHVGYPAAIPDARPRISGESLLTLHE